jgi:hypothetical protein
VAAVAQERGGGAGIPAKLDDVGCRLAHWLVQCMDKVEGEGEGGWTCWRRSNFHKDLLEHLTSSANEVEEEGMLVTA